MRKSVFESRTHYTLSGWGLSIYIRRHSGSTNKQHKKLLVCLLRSLLWSSKVAWGKPIIFQLAPDAYQGPVRTIASNCPKQLQQCKWLMNHGVSFLRDWLLSTKLLTFPMYSLTFAHLLVSQEILDRYEVDNYCEPVSMAIHLHGNACDCVPMQLPSK